MLRFHFLHNRNAFYPGNQSQCYAGEHARRKGPRSILSTTRGTISPPVSGPSVGSTMNQTTRNDDETEHSNRDNGFGASESWIAGRSFADRAGEFRELDEHGTRFDVISRCHAWEGQDHE